VLYLEALQMCAQFGQLRLEVFAVTFVSHPVAGVLLQPAVFFGEDVRLSEEARVFVMEGLAHGALPSLPRDARTDR
jgi:hypothetical protein